MVSDTFENCGLLGKDIKASQFIATSGEDFVQKLQGNPSFIFTLIQKFNKPDEKSIYPDHDIIIMSDEAHRSQYGIFADNIMKLLPTAARIGFTGTPLLSSDNITTRTFGGYVSVYDFKRAVEDGVTVPLYYENRGEKIVDLHNPAITNQILDAIENADLDVDQQDKLEAEFAKEIHLLTAEPRLKSIAQDFVRHYSDLWTSGKAMFVCLNKVTCVRMYNYVQEYWKAEIKTLKASLKYASQQETPEHERKIKWMDREGFTSDEELSLYDMLFRDDLSKTDIKKLKEVAASLLQKIKTKIAEFDHWTDKQETKAAIDNLIRDTLWAELPECYDEVSISMYRQKIYEYVYTRYREVA